MKQCCFVDLDTGLRCVVFGLPELDEQYFTCDGCLVALERCLNEVATKLENRHANN